MCRRFGPQGSVKSASGFISESPVSDFFYPHDYDVSIHAPATELFLTGKSEEQVARLAKMPPLERLGEPEDIASVVSFLAGSDGGWVNGQVVRVNGGFV